MLHYTQCEGIMAPAGYIYASDCEALAGRRLMALGEPLAEHDDFLNISSRDLLTLVRRTGLVYLSRDDIAILSEDLCLNVLLQTRMH